MFRSLSLNKAVALSPISFKKETLTQVFSSEFGEILRNTLLNAIAKSRKVTGE